MGVTPRLSKPKTPEIFSGTARPPMLKANLNSSDSQIAFGNFIVRLLQHNENTGIARTPEDALALATAAIGGDARAGALVRAFASLLAYVDTKLPQNSNVLDEEHLATSFANQIAAVFLCLCLCLAFAGPALRCVAVPDL